MKVLRQAVKAGLTAASAAGCTSVSIPSLMAARFNDVPDEGLPSTLVPKKNYVGWLGVAAMPVVLFGGSKKVWLTAGGLMSF